MEKFKLIINLIIAFTFAYVVANWGKWRREDMIAEAHTKVIVSEIESVRNPKTKKIVVSIYERSDNLLNIFGKKKKIKWEPFDSPGVYFRLILNDGDLPSITIPPGPATNYLGAERGISSLRVEVDANHHPKGNVIGKILVMEDDE